MKVRLVRRFASRLGRHGIIGLAFLLGLVFLSPAQAQPDYAPALWNQAYPGHWYTSGNGHNFCVIHDMEGYYESTISYFQQQMQGTSYASIHYCVNGLQNGNDAAHGHVENTPGDAPVGEITQMVREQYYAWHVSCWNTYMFGTEHEGFVNSPVWYTEGMYQASAALQRHLCTTYNIPMDRHHIIGHNEWQNPAWTNWLIINWPQIDPTCNNHTDPGQYWNWSHFMDLVVSNTPPSIGAPFLNRVADQGTNVTFAPDVIGIAPLTYKWLFNGAVINGATNSTYSLANVQSNNVGGYTLIASNAYGAVTSSVAVLTVNPVVPWVMVYSDNFDSNSAANWKLFQASGDNVSDYTTNWAFDYSSTKFTFDGVTNTIPVAPKTTNGTRVGLKITVNKNDANVATSGVSLYPKNLTFSNNYTLRFDMWINYNGGSGGGTGSTEYATFGINHAGTRVNWGAGNASVSDGLWFAATGEGGAAVNYAAYSGNASGNPTQLSLAAGGFGANGVQSLSSDPLFNSIFLSFIYETPGFPGKHWVQGEVSQYNKVITWKVNGVVVAERTNSTAFANGDVMIGYMDIFSSIANPPQDNYVIFDNVQVLQEGIAPVISAQPQDVARIQGSGSNATFTVTATGLPTPQYQWKFNTTNLTGATNSAYTIANPQAADAGNYSVVVSNSLNTATSSNATLTVYVPPSITNQPPNRTVIQGHNAVFTLQVNGSPTLYYQWQFSASGTGFTNIPNATNATYIVLSAQPGQAGYYCVIVTNNYGTVTSNPASLTVNTAPGIADGPNDQSVPIGGTATFTVTASGIPAPGYQWYFKGVPIGGATTNAYILPNVRTTNAGNYSVIVSNSVATTPSSNALLTVTVPPPQFEQINVSPDGTLSMIIDGPPNCTFAVDTSSNLLNWSQIATFTNSTGPYPFTDASATNRIKGFYRVRWLSD